MYSKFDVLTVVGAEGDVNMILRRDLAGCRPRSPGGKTAEHGYMDDVIEPRESRVC
jgi:hypothetical protein